MIESLISADSVTVWWELKTGLFCEDKLIMVLKGVMTTGGELIAHGFALKSFGHKCLIRFSCHLLTYFC